jgi:hypothetical protein
MQEDRLNPEPVKTKSLLDITEYEDNTLGGQDIPPMGSLEWTDYVLSMMVPEELYNNLPKVDGLRRVAAELLGPIVKSKSRVISSEVNYAVVEHTYVFAWDHDKSDLRSFTDVADINTVNTVEPFINHATSVASTKAKGRALREALQLRGILAAEEMGVPDESSVHINSSQIATIKTLCNRLSISLNKLLQAGKPMVEKVEDLPYGRAVSLIRLLNEYQQEKKVIPEKILGGSDNES